MPAKSRLFLLEDDCNLAETIKEYLEELGYEVVAAVDGEAAQDILYEQRFDLLMLDVNVPGLQGFDLLQESRARSDETPAIFITSRDGIEDVSLGYESGCDDYLKKPFALKELHFRIRALLKRGYFHKNDALLQIDEHCSYDIERSILRCEGRVEPLSGKEGRLLKLLLQNSHRVVSHEEIYEALWEYDEEPSSESLRTYIKNLRKIVGKERIVSHKRLGYRLSTQ